MKSFKEYVTEGTGANAADLETNVQKDDETKALDVQAKGEKEFKKMHKADVKGHPVATDAQFKG